MIATICSIYKICVVTIKTNIFGKVITAQHLQVILHGGGVLLGILGGGVPPGSPNPDPISDQKMSFSHPYSDETSKELCLHYLDWNTNKNDF